MDHEYYRDRVSAYVDGALPPYEQMALEEHIAQCAECRALLEKLRKLEAMVQDSSALGESDYWEGQAQKIETRLGLGQTEVMRIGPTRSWRGLGWKLTAAAASIVVVGVIGFYSWESIRERTDRPSVQMAPSLPPASVAEPQNIQPVQEKADEAKKAQSTREPGITDTQNYKRSAVVERRESGGGVVKYQTGDQVSIGNGKAKSVAAPVEPVPISDLSESDISLKSIDVPARPVVPGDSSPRAEEQSFVKLTAVAPPAASVAAESRPDSAAQRGPAVKGLAYWQAIRDSLGEDKSPMHLLGKSIANVRDAQPSSLAAGLVQKKDSTDRYTLLLEAYFRIAQLSKDTVEIAAATDHLREIADDSKSPRQKTAREYLDSLGIK
jgi:hypothetical protein